MNCLNWVYPHVCGGTIQDLDLACLVAGLSPRVRGNLVTLPLPDWTAGSIPTCAGEPTSGASAPPSTRVYPHVCGGTDAGDASAVWDWGLSPRVRGNRDREGIHDHLPGSIPTCAGEPLPESK